MIGIIILTTILLVVWTIYCFKRPTAIEKENIGDFSDGYHTFNELYEYRMLYNAMIFNELAMQGFYDIHKSKLHHDGKAPFGNPDYFIVVAELPTGQISNHYRMKHWDLFQIPEKERSNEWDGHTPSDVANRIREFLKIYKNENY